MRALLLLVSAAGLCAAGPADPDWPCIQRLVPSLTAETLWPGHGAKSDWRADPVAAALVRSVMARGLAVEDGIAQLQRFAASRPGDEALAEVFAGLVDESNAERGRSVERLREIARHQRALADATARVTSELNALPADAPPARREEVTSRRALMIRQYEEVQRTIRYSCEIPVEIEGRLGRFAQALQRSGG
jgi:hypothetical protein